MAWSTKLKVPIRLADGRWIRTCTDARAIILSLPESLRHHDRWGATAQKLMDVAERDGDRDDLQLYLTQNLRVDNMLPVKTRSRPR